MAAAQRARLTRQLEGPPSPSRIAYLVRWVAEIHGRSGMGMSGYAPATYDTIGKWARMAGIDDLTAEETRVLFLLDGVLCAFDAAKYQPKVDEWE